MNGQHSTNWLISVFLAFLAFSSLTSASPFISQNQPEWVQRSLEREFGAPPKMDAREFMKALIMVLQEGEMAKMGAKNMDELFTEIEEKRAPFSSWGGKRDSDHFDRHIRANSFSAWGGKRDDLAELIKAKLEARSRRNSADSAIKVIRPARAAFSAWGGRK